jgi:glyoxylase-like metal-dependent hydrolase (beta-lactamase superfamily II)
MISTFTGGIAATNGYLLDSPEGKLLIDAPEGITQWLQKRGASPVALFLTHQHFDHVMDAQSVKATFGCPIYAWAPYSQDLTLEALFGMVSGMAMSVPPYEVDHLVAGQPKLTLGGIEWSLSHIPGHSPDSACLYEAASGTLFSGDVLFEGSIGRTDFPGGSQKQLVEGIHTQLWPLPDATVVYPGHGEPTTIGMERAENPYC